jgi:hypothetical protein
MGTRDTFAAFHEAGHAVMCIEERMRVLRVSIVPDEVPDSGGYVRHARVFGRMTPDFDDRKVTRRGVERLVRVAFAGDIAVAIWNSRIHSRFHAAGVAGNEMDEQRASSLLANQSGSDDEVNAWYQLLKIRTINSLTMPSTWTAVEALAAALLDRKSMSGADARRLVRATIEHDPDDYSPRLTKARERLSRRAVKLA